MDKQRFRQLTAQFHDLLQREQDIKDDIKEFEAILKSGAALTNMEVRATKRVLKAEIKGELDKFQQRMDDEQAVYTEILYNLITDKKVVDKKVVAIPHDPETEEIIQSADDKTADVAPDSTQVSQDEDAIDPPQGEAKVRDSLPNELPSAHPFEGERGASAPSHDDVSRVQDGPDIGIGATNYGNPSHQSPNEIIPDMPAFMQRSG